MLRPFGVPLDVGFGFPFEGFEVDFGVADPFGFGFGLEVGLDVFAFPLGPEGMRFELLLLSLITDTLSVA